MAIKAGLKGLKDREFGISDKQVAMTVRQGNVGFIIYSEHSEGYYKILISEDARLRIVGGSAQRESGLAQEITLEERDYNYIVRTSDPKEALVRTLVIVKGFLKDRHRGLEGRAGMGEREAIGMFALRNDIRRVEEFILCARG